jgi:mercuric ion transport protein
MMQDEKRAISAAGSALGFGTLAAAIATCCGVPWAVTVLGVTGAVALARLAFLLPYAIAGAILLLAVAFWLVYRKPASCEIGSHPSASRALRWLVWIAALVVAAMATFALTPIINL